MTVTPRVKTLVIDGHDVSARETETILEAAQEQGIFIPTLCRLEGLSEVGACRLCLVEVKGINKLLPACVTRVEEGMEVSTRSERLDRYRRTVLELLFAEGNHICSVCVANGHCELQSMAQRLGMDHVRVPYVSPRRQIDASHERFTFDFVICATGVRYGLAQRPELTGIAHKVALWADRFTPLSDEAHPELGKLPYLGTHFEFLEKRPGGAPWLSHIYAFNFSGFVSMGPVATSITGHRFGVPRLVRGITRSLFLEQADAVLPSLHGFAEPEIDLNAATMYSPPAQDIAAK